MAEQLVEVVRRERANVVADVSSEVDGRAETGSLDLEDRNALARTVVRQATVVVVVGRGTTTGVPTARAPADRTSNATASTGTASVPC